MCMGTPTRERVRNRTCQRGSRTERERGCIRHPKQTVTGGVRGRKAIEGQLEEQMLSNYRSLCRADRSSDTVSDKLSFLARPPVQVLGGEEGSGRSFSWACRAQSNPPEPYLWVTRSEPPQCHLTSGHGLDELDDLHRILKGMSRPSGTRKQIRNP